MQTYKGLDEEYRGHEKKGTRGPKTWSWTENMVIAKCKFEKT